METVGAGFSTREAAAVSAWCRAAGTRPGAGRKEPVYLPLERKMELAARCGADERAANLAAEAGVSAASVSAWARRLREEGVICFNISD